jgi:hypothetical protein
MHWELTRARGGVFVDICLLLGHMQLALLELGGLDEVLHWWQKVMEVTLVQSPCPAMKSGSRLHGFSEALIN